MFNQNNRYVTRGINEVVTLQLQLIMWGLIDNLKAKGNIEIDYLQVFKLIKINDEIIIEHIQEEPEYKASYKFNLGYLDMDEVNKVYVIDSGEYSTMILPEEY